MEKQEPKRLSIEEQDKDNKGIVFPKEDKSGSLVDSMILKPIYYSPKLILGEIVAFYIDIEKYPQLKDNPLEYIDSIVDTTNMVTNNDAGSQGYEIYIFDEYKDLYFLREFVSQSDILLGIEKLRPLLQISYSPNIITSVCIYDKYTKQYFSVGKAYSTGWNWESLGNNSCGYGSSLSVAGKKSP